MRLITRSPYDMSMEGPLSQAKQTAGAHYSCHVGPTELLTGHTPENVPGEEGGVVKTVKGEATVRIEGVAFVYAQPGLGNGGMCARKQFFSLVTRDLDTIICEFKNEI